MRGRGRPDAARGSSPRVRLDRPRCPSWNCGELSARPSPPPLGHCQRQPAAVWVVRLGPSRANAAPAGPGLMGRSAGSGRSRPFLSRPSRFAQPSPPHKNQRRRGGRAPCAKRTAALALPKWEYETHRHEAPQRRARSSQRTQEEFVALRAERSVKALQHLAIWNFSRRVGPTRPNGMLTPCTAPGRSERRRVLGVWGPAD